MAAERFLNEDAEKGAPSLLFPMRKSLTKRERLKRRADLARLFADPRKVGCLGLVILYQENGLAWNRIAVTTTKRGYRGSAQRNREKRIGREIYRGNKERIRTGFDMILIFRPGSFSFWEREKQFRMLIERAGLNL